MMSRDRAISFSGDNEQRLAVKRALEELHDAGFSDQYIADVLGSDVAAGRVAGVRQSTRSPVSRPTIQRIRKATPDSLLNVRTRQMAALYAFLRQSEEFETELSAKIDSIRSTHSLAPLLDAVQQHMGATDGPLDNRKLKSLEGAFYLFRKAWTSPYAESYVRCVLRFDWVGDALFYSEEQKFFDTVEKLPTDELDNGIVVPFGMNVVLLGRGQDKDLLKFFSFHDFTPYPDGHQHVHRMSGNFIAVYSKGPHPGFGAYARRVEEEEGEPTCAFYAPGELDEETIFRITNASIGGPSTVGWRK